MVQVIIEASISCKTPQILAWQSLALAPGFRRLSRSDLQNVFGLGLVGFGVCRA